MINTLILDAADGAADAREVRAVHHADGGHHGLLQGSFNLIDLFYQLSVIWV